MPFYSTDHEWVSIADGVATVGISRHAADALGDLVFVDGREVGTAVRAREPVAVVESVKAASDVYSPVSGTVLETNPRLADEPELVNADPEGEGWLVRLRPAEDATTDGLMGADEYGAFLEENA